MYKKITLEFYGRPLSIETGHLAKQASGAAVVVYGETVVLVTVVATNSPREGIDFFPLTVDYQEYTFAAGKIPGGFFKREGRPSEREILTSRLVDRALRPLFPKGFGCETQVVASVLSVDRENDADTVALIRASAALQVSDIPFQGPIAGVRIGRLGGTLVVNPLQSQVEMSDINLFVAAGRDATVMVEGGGRMVSEEDMLEALFLAQYAVKPVLDVQDEIARVAGKQKRSLVAVPPDTALIDRVRDLAADKLPAALSMVAKHERAAAIAAAKEEVKTALAEEYAGREKEVEAVFEDLTSQTLRSMVVRENRRVDGRSPTDIRPITCEVKVLPRTHGSALFTRGETQALAVTTLGTGSDEQKVDALIGEQYKKFMLHYNFPPFSVGEVRPMRGPGRREIGHGALAERALLAVLPEESEFPYTIRIVSEILESNGSSSMATVCGGALSIIEETGVKIDVEDDGTVYVSSLDGDSMNKAVALINRVTAEAEIGKIYKGTVRKIVDFGAFVEILPGTDGLVHISQLGPGRVRRVSDVLKEGDEVMVKVLEIDRQGKIRLSRKEALQETGNGPSGTGSDDSSQR